MLAFAVLEGLSVPDKLDSLGFGLVDKPLIGRWFGTIRRTGTHLLLSDLVSGLLKRDLSLLVGSEMARLVPLGRSVEFGKDGVDNSFENLNCKAP